MTTKGELKNINETPVSGSKKRWSETEFAKSPLLKVSGI